MVAFSYGVDLISDGYVEAPMWIPQSALLIGYGLLILSALNRYIHIFFDVNSIIGSNVSTAPSEIRN